jgi:hypothetical protein
MGKFPRVIPHLSRAGAVTVALFVALAGSPASIALGQSQPPITINSCAPILRAPMPKSFSTPGPSFLGIPLTQMTSTSGGMTIKFVNESKVTANLVNFAVDSNGNRFVVRDVGKFSPGITIVHQFDNGRGQGFILPQFIAPNVKCHVASAEFVDGTVWTHGQTAALEPPPPAPHGLTATPARVVLNPGAESAIFLVQSPARVAGFKETDNCSGLASVNVGAAGDAAVSYSVRPIGPGTCTAHVINENGTTASIPITVH